MQFPHILVVEPQLLVANDMREEVLALSRDAVVHLAPTVSAAGGMAGDMSRIDLLIVSSHSAACDDAAGCQRLAEQARAVLVVGEAEDGEPPCPALRGAPVAQTPFTSFSLRRNLRGINVDGAPLFPRKCRT